MADFEEKDKDQNKDMLTADQAGEKDLTEKNGSTDGQENAGVSATENTEKKNSAEGEEQKESEYEDVCFICRRPESKAGKMFKLPNNISVCNDCMHKTMDAVSQFDYQGMLDPDFMNSLNQDMSKKGFPNIRFLNIADQKKEESRRGRAGSGYQEYSASA